MNASPDEPRGHAYHNITVSGDGRLHAGDSFNSEWTTKADMWFECTHLRSKDHVHINITRPESGFDTAGFGIFQAIPATTLLTKQLIAQLQHVCKAVPVIPQVVGSILAEVEACEEKLRSFALFYSISSYSEEVASRIPASQLHTSFTSGIILIDELHRIIEPLRSEHDALAWEAKIPMLMSIRERLQWQSLTWGMQARLLKEYGVPLFV